MTEHLARAYAEEHRACVATGQDERLAVVVAELRKLGYRVTDDGLERLDDAPERADQKAPENTAAPRPRARRA